MKNDRLKSQKFFLEKYKSLNKEQKDAVDTIDGPVMVIAGPGTGKTSILTLRIANILRLTDTPPESILALTFTDSAVVSMKRKLFEIVGESAYRVKISTFHSFANEIIQNYPHFFEKIIGGKPAGEIGQVKIVKDILEKNDFKEIKTLNSPLYYLNHLRSAINHLKKEGYTPVYFKKWLNSQNYLVEGRDESKYKRSLELVKLFELYEKKLIKDGLYDYEDMLLETAEAFRKHKKLLRDLQENYLYILADEHQDANGNQNKILEELASYDDNPNLFIVGDEKQAIYRFQGASLENFLYFKNKFPKSKIITLIKNYRSTQEILDASHHLSLSMDNGGEIKRERLLSNSKKSAPVSVICFNHEDDELDFVTIKAIEISKVKNVAILYRDNNDVLEIGRRLRKRKADFSIKSDENILGDDDIKNFINFLKTINDPTNNEILSKTLFLDFLELPLISSLKLIKSSKYSSAIINSLDGDLSKLGISEEDSKQFRSFYQKLKTWSLKGRNESLLGFLDIVFEESGFKSKILSSPNPVEKIEKFRSFYAIARSSAESKNSVRLSDFIRDLELFETFNLNASDLVHEHEGSKIVLMTAHKSKGLEFDVVFIIKANEEKWAGKNKKEYFILPLQKDESKENRNMDERRLFYVAMTRGKERVIITYSEKDYKGKILSKSSFIDNIDGNLINLEKGKADSLYLKNEIKDDRSKAKKDLQEYVSNTLLNEGLNVTALNNYLSCPWKYFFQNLIKIPHREEKHQQFGTAIHYALKMSAEDLNSGIKPSFSKAVKYFSTEISKMDFSKEELVDWKQRGEKALQSFFKGHIWAKDIKAEFKISNIPFSSSAGIIVLRGNIDQLINKTNGNFSVVDFKTGNNKTRNEILGNTKNSNGDIFRQLLFYKLLLETYFKDKKVEDGIIEFVEPDNKGRFKQENFDLNSENLDNLKKEINDLIKGVMSLNFLDKKCDERECEFCAMGEILKQKIPSK